HVHGDVHVAAETVLRGVHGQIQRDLRRHHGARQRAGRNLGLLPGRRGGAGRLGQSGGRQQGGGKQGTAQDHRGLSRSGNLGSLTRRRGAGTRARSPVQSCTEACNAAASAASPLARSRQASSTPLRRPFSTSLSPWPSMVSVYGRSSIWISRRSGFSRGVVMAAPGGFPAAKDRRGM